MNNVSKASSKKNFVFSQAGMILAYSGDEEACVIPRRIGAVVFRRIHNRAFANSFSLHKAVIPKGIRVIGCGVFGSCKALRSVKNSYAERYAKEHGLAYEVM